MIRLSACLRGGSRSLLLNDAELDRRVDSFCTIRSAQLSVDAQGPVSNRAGSEVEHFRDVIVGLTAGQ